MSDITDVFLDGLPSPLWADDASVLFYKKWSQAISIMARRDLEMVDFAVSNPNAMFGRMDAHGFKWDEVREKWVLAGIKRDERSRSKILVDRYAAGLLYGDDLADLLIERDNLRWWRNVWLAIALTALVALWFVAVVVNI